MALSDLIPGFGIISKGLDLAKGLVSFGQSLYNNYRADKKTTEDRNIGRTLQAVDDQKATIDQAVEANANEADNRRLSDDALDRKLRGEDPTAPAAPHR